MIADLEQLGWCALDWSVGGWNVDDWGMGVAVLRREDLRVAPDGCGLTTLTDQSEFLNSE